MKGQKPISSEFGEIEDRLEQERPVPRASFRGDLRRHLTAGRRRSWNLAQRYRLVAATSTAAGAVCLAIAAIGVVGAGPFAT
jgi:hypothetical protein